MQSIRSLQLSAMLVLNILLILCLHNVLALPRFPFYTKYPNGEVILDLPPSIQLFVEFAPRITLRTLTRILKNIAADRDRKAMEAEAAAEAEVLVELKQNGLATNPNEDIDDPLH